VGDGFVAGKFERAREGLGGLDRFGLHGLNNFSMGEISAVVTEGRDNR
jgi:hypothetical protein